ncbi:MAG: 50S ribosomal protein L15 [Proteobacteria bacterium]|nr:50S ribosomal protein L15 [Pseudomonadota bacterium]
MKLNQLRDNPGSRKAARRLGRGNGSGRGGTSGRGHKGQKSRSGVSLLGFEGGQMPLYRRLPKRGFKNPFRKNYAVVNIGSLQRAVDAGRLDASKPVSEEAVLAAGLVKNRRDGVRLLAKGALNAKLTIEVTGASEAAKAAVAAAGGKVVVTGREDAKARKAEKAEQAAARKAGKVEKAERAAAGKEGKEEKETKAGKKGGKDKAGKASEVAGKADEAKKADKGEKSGKQDKGGEDAAGEGEG